LSRGRVVVGNEVVGGRFLRFLRRRQWKRFILFD